MTLFKRHPLLAPTALALLLATGPALAGGNTADGHSHGAMHDAMMKNGMADTMGADMHAHAAGHAHGHGEGGPNPVGEPGDAARVQRTVRITMSDTMRYSPARVTVKQGETIRFDVRNTGALKHELVLGTRQALIAHAEMMKKMPEMEHDDPQMVTVKPGDRGEIIWHFTQAGTVEFACLQPGHFEAGMKGAVAVKAAPSAKKKPSPVAGAAHDHAH